VNLVRGESEPAKQPVRGFEFPTARSRADEMAARGAWEDGVLPGLAGSC
jgi:hypothetical protein